MILMDVVSIGAGFVENIMFSGIVLGWPSLQVVLEDIGYFQDRCEMNGNLTANATTDCDAREASFNLVFTLATAFLFFMLFPSGYVLDKFGMWLSRSLFVGLHLIGFILISISSPDTSNLLFPSIVLIGFSGSSFLMSNVQMVNLSKHGRGTLIALMDGAYDSGTLGFYLIKKLTDSGVRLNAILWVLTGLVIFPLLKTFVLMPKRFVPFPLPKGFKYGWREWPCFKMKKIKNQEIQTIKIRETSCLDDNYNLSSGQNDQQNTEITFAQCLRNKLFWSTMFHYTLIAFRTTFFLGSYIAWVRHFQTNEEVKKSAEMLNLILLFSFPAAPLIGLIIDGARKCAKQSTKVKKVINLKGAFVAALVTSFLSILLSISVLIPSVLASILFLTVCKTYLYCSCTSFVMFLFPVKHLGKLYGLINFTAGVAFLLQNALFRFGQKYDPSFRFIHLGLCALTVSTLIHPLLIYLEAKKIEKKSSTKQKVTLKSVVDHQEVK